METAKKPKSKSNGNTDKKIISAFQEYWLINGSKPPSVFKFCLDNNLRESDFYDSFGSFEGLENTVWRNFIDETIGRLRGDKSFATFSTREKILAFYFTFFELLKNNRSYVLLQLKEYKRLELTPYFLKDLKKHFETFTAQILEEGKGSGEVATRPYLDKRYPQLLWFHFGFLLQFWKEDNSAGLESTDAAIEKSVNLAFDLIGKGAVDTAIDLAKFLYQAKVK